MLHALLIAGIIEVPLLIIFWAIVAGGSCNEGVEEKYLS